MFIASRQNKVTAPAEPNAAAAVTHGAPLERDSSRVECYKHLAPAGAESRLTHYGRARNEQDFSGLVD